MVATIILFIVWGIGLGISAARHGQPRTDNYNFWNTFLATALEVILLWWAGLFEVFK